ncbi:hypothetical protein Cgig2_000557 [Carnegiea gigantea]|uniref:25S rRNA (uridine-N(3))-methyltransferase BMT5-like domain-containing protein n=1 Tax=Carnegiea gigantea TaxID=171969 RepID=A0A9Q1JMG2_9CARY|nr:hypothetical protein Cgig2_000557 [Carnegiea gigantea]
MGQIASSFLRCLGVEVKEDGADNRRLISHAKGLSDWISICPDHVTELQQSVSRRVMSTNIDAHHSLADAMAILNEKRLIGIPCSGSYRDPDIDHDDLHFFGLDNSSMSYLDQETEAVNYVEEIKDVITSKHEPRGAAKRVFSSTAKNMTTVDFVHGSNVQGATSKEIMLDERRLEPCASSASGRCGGVVEGTSPLPVSHKAFSSQGSIANTILSISVYSPVSPTIMFQSTDSSFYAEEIKHVIMSKDEPRELAKRVFGNEVENTTKLDFVNDSNGEETIVSQDIGLNKTRIGSCNTSSTPRRSCWVVKGISPPVLDSQEAFSSAANMVTTSCSSHAPVAKHEEIKDVIMKKREPKGPAKLVVGSEVENMTKLDSINGRNIQGTAITKDMMLHETRLGPNNTGLTPGKCCWMVKGTSPPVLVSQEAFSSAANTVTTCCNLQGNITKQGSIGPYNSTQRILLVGEGDFSFSTGLAVAFGSASNMVATSLNSLGFLIKNYGNFPTNLSALETRGSVVLHGVDATKMAKHPHLARMKFDRIIFNFPHTGFKQDSPESEIRSPIPHPLSFFFQTTSKASERFLKKCTEDDRGGWSDTLIFLENNIIPQHPSPGH